MPWAPLCITGSHASGGDHPTASLDSCSNPLCRAPHPGHVDIWGPVTLVLGGPLYLGGCLVAPLVSSHGMPDDHLATTINNVSRQCHMSTGGRIILWLRTTELGLAVSSLSASFPKYSCEVRQQEKVFTIGKCALMGGPRPWLVPAGDTSHMAINITRPAPGGTIHSDPLLSWGKKEQAREVKQPA